MEDTEARAERVALARRIFSQPIADLVCAAQRAESRESRDLVLQSQEILDNKELVIKIGSRRMGSPTAQIPLSARQMAYIVSQAAADEGMIEPTEVKPVANVVLAAVAPTIARIRAVVTDLSEALEAADIDPVARTADLETLEWCRGSLDGDLVDSLGDLDVAPDVDQWVDGEDIDGLLADVSYHVYGNCHEGEVDIVRVEEGRGSCHYLSTFAHDVRAEWKRLAGKVAERNHDWSPL